jgi:hypothetical protein
MQFWSIVLSLASGVCGGLVLAHPSAAVRRLGAGSALCALSALPYSLAFLQPIFVRVQALSKEKADGEQVDALFETWLWYYNGRYVAWTGAWVLAMGALALSGGVLGELVEVVYRGPA